MVAFHGTISNFKYKLYLRRYITLTLHGDLTPEEGESKASSAEANLHFYHLNVCLPMVLSE